MKKYNSDKNIQFFKDMKQKYLKWIEKYAAVLSSFQFENKPSVTRAQKFVLQFYFLILAKSVIFQLFLNTFSQDTVNIFVSSVLFCSKWQLLKNLVQSSQKLENYQVMAIEELCFHF